MADGTTTTTQNPWSPIQPYLVGGVNQGGQQIPGIADQASYLYGQQQNLGMPSYLNNAYNSVINQGQNYGNSQGSQMINQNAQNILSGSGVPQINPVGQIGPAAQGSASQGSFNLSNLGLGNQPQNAYSQLLSGQVNTDPYNATFNAASQRLNDQFSNVVNPAINQGAQMAGQYGGSRQGIAQGLAAKGLGQAQSDLAANMYGNAYGQAQNNMAGAANALGGYSTSITNNNAAMGTQASLANAGMQNNQQQFNANLGLSNNSQQMQNYNNMIGGAQTAAGMLGNNAQTQYNLGLGGLNAPNNANNYNWQQLGNYQGAIQPLAGMGNTQTTPYYTNPLATGLGAAGAIGNIWNSVTG